MVYLMIILSPLERSFCRTMNAVRLHMFRIQPMVGGTKRPIREVTELVTDDRTQGRIRVRHEVGALAYRKVGAGSYRHFFLGWRIRWSVTELQRLSEIIECRGTTFHMEDKGRTIVDREGIELGDLDEAREEAVAAARQLISEHVLRGRAANGRRFVITDEGGTVLAKVSFNETIDN